MAANPVVVPITPPRVAFLTPDGFIAREWYRFLLSLATQASIGVEITDFIQYAPDATATNAALETELADVRQTLNALPPIAQDPLLLDTRQTLNQLPPAATVDQLAVLQASIDALAASPASGAYSVASGVTSIANGGTGVSSTPANGQIDIGNGLGFTRTTLTAGAGASISNTAGSITISATGTGGTVTSVTGTSPVVSSGGTTPAISMPAATTSVSGYLTSTDWTTFNGKGSGSVTSVSGTGTVNGITLTGTVTTSGSLTLGGALSGVSLTSQVSGTLPVANGGTGLSSTPVNGALDIGNGSGFTRTTLTAGSGVSISNTSGAISISATGTGGTVTSVAALTLGTTGTDLSSTVANGTTTPVITLQVPTASAANRGALSAADWTTFNNKGSGSVTSVAQSFTGGLISVAGSPITTSGTLALTVAGTSGGIPYFASGTTWATSAALATNAIVLGGGAGGAPATTTTGTGVVTALGVNTGTAGAFVVNGGALGAPSSGTVTNLTGTASININGTVGATTAAAGKFTTLAATGALTYGGITLNSAVTGTGNMVLSTSPTLVTPALGTPSSGTVTNLTGTASININGTVGATTPTTGAFTTVNTLTVGLGGSSVVSNTAVGVSALTANTSGQLNAAFGYQAMKVNTSGICCVGVGYTALNANTSGSGNVMVGGWQSNGVYNPPFDPTTQNDRVMIGSAATSNAYVAVAWTVTSDARDKTDFAPVPHGLDFIAQLKPTAYRYKFNRNDTEGHGPLRYGFLAQDILALEGNAPVIIDNEDPDRLKLTDQNLIAVLVNAVQELQALVIDLNARVIG